MYIHTRTYTQRELTSSQDQRRGASFRRGTNKPTSEGLEATTSEGRRRKRAGTIRRDLLLEDHKSDFSEVTSENYH